MATTLRAVFTDAAGRLCVLCPAEGRGSVPRLAGESEADWVQRVADLDVPAGLPRARVVPLADLPPRRWRAAWQDTGAAVVVGMVRARLVRKAELLVRRAVVLALTTDALEKAVDDGDSGTLVQALRAKRRRLRSLDDTLDAGLAALATPEELDSFTPADLA